jgi:ketosteroid isomerase-like protein
LFAAFRAGDIDAVRAAIGDDAVWHFPGRTGKLAGDHAGRDAILAFLANVMGLTAGTFRLELIDVVASDANAVALFRGHGERNGRVLDNPTCLRMRIANGRIVELWEFVWNLYDVDAFWA